MNKKEVYKKIVKAMKEYRKSWIIKHKHDSFIYGYIFGLLESLYLTNVINFIEFWVLKNYISHKTSLYYRDTICKRLLT